MATDKPEKPANEFLPNGFGTGSGVIKNDFSDDKKINGFSAQLEDILQGDNLNYTLDTIGKQLKYLTTVVDYINNISVLKVPFINGSNKLDFTDINGLLPSQTSNNGKYLTTNGTTCSWSNDFIRIGDPQITLNFNQVLPDNCVWLDGTAGENHDGVVPITGDWATLFAIYGWVYDTSYNNTDSFRLPNFTNRAIWGGTTAGYISAGLPNITGYIGRVDGGNSASGVFYANGTAGKLENQSGQPDPKVYMDASRPLGSLYGKSNTVQPPAIKVRVYTRYK